MRSLLMTLLLATTAAAQTTWYVDDDAPNDPGPGDPTISDPLEDGSEDHPFDAIQEAIFVSADGDTVLVRDGTYTGTLNKNIDFGGLAITVRSENGPDACVIDCEGSGRGFQFRFDETYNSVLQGVSVVNGSAADGGAVRVTAGSSPTIRNCAFGFNNADDKGGAVYAESPSTMLLVGCRIYSNTAHDGGGVHARTRCDILDCEIVGNDASGGAGGGLIVWAGSTIAGCYIADNTTDSFGGGVYAPQAATLTSNILWSNDAGQGGGLATLGGNVAVSASTFSGNSAIELGGAVYANTGFISVSDSVLWNDSATAGPELAVLSGTITVDYSDVEGGWAWAYIGDNGTLDWGEGNIVADPRFIDPANGDYHLSGDSPCLDAGDRAYAPQPGEADIDGQLRVWNGRIDMGADEFGSRAFGDLNCDGELDSFDIEAFIAALFDPDGYETQYPDCERALADLNGDGTVDAFDIEAFIALLFGP